MFDDLKELKEKIVKEEKEKKQIEEKAEKEKRLVHEFEDYMKDAGIKKL